MDSKDIRMLMEAYQQVNKPIDEAVKGQDSGMRQAAAAERRGGDKKLSPSKGKGYADQQKQSISYMDKLTKKNKNVVGLVTKEEIENVDEATAMAKRGYDETKLRKRAGGGEAADRASALEKKPTYGDASKAKQRSEYARKQRGDFRKTSSSSPGLHGYGHKSDDPKVKAKQAARGAQRGALTPNERKQLNMGDETFDIFDVVLEFLQVEGYAETLEEAEWMMANVIDEEAIDIILGEAITSEKGKAKMKAMLDARTTASGRAKAGKGENVAQIKHIGRANVDGYGGTPPNRKVAKNPVKSNFTGLKTGSGNKAARRAGTYREEFEAWLDEALTGDED